MNGPTGSSAAASVNGVHHNGYESNDDSVAADASDAGGIFQNSTPEDHANHQSVVDRSSSVHRPASTFMNQGGADSGAGEPSGLGHAVGSDHESSEGDASELSSYGSSAGSEQADVSGLEQPLAGLTVNEAGFSGDCYCGRDQILEALTSGLRKLDSLSATANSSEGVIKYENAREELNQMISNSLNFRSTNRFEELNDIARGIQTWQEANGASLEQHSFKPCDLKIPDLVTGMGVQVKFGDVINGIANTGVMLDLGGGVEILNTYLDGCDVTMTGYSLCTDMRKEVCMPLLAFSFTRGNIMELPDFCYLLDGNENRDWKHCACELDGYLNPVFQDVRETGGSVPASTLEGEYSHHAIDDRSPEESHSDAKPVRVEG